jgi:hypothetical protein
VDVDHGVRRKNPHIARQIAALASSLLLIWSALFASTYRYPFYWDDYEQIRPYSWHELRSTLHGWSDPDKAQTPAFRPVATFLFALQGSSFGENVVSQKIFQTFLMWILLFVFGIFLAELWFRFAQVSIVVALFVSSRVFASVNMWLTLSPLILCYIFMTLTGYLFLLWIKHRRVLYVCLMFVCVVLGVLTREEAYVLPVALPLLWLLSSRRWQAWLQMLLPVLGVFAIVAIHVILRHVFVPEAPSPDLSILKLKMFFTSLASAWLPGGYSTIGLADGLLKVLWIAFLTGLTIVFVRVSPSRWRWRALGTCGLGIALTLPALGIPRSFGITTPTLAFMTAISMIIGIAYHRLELLKQCGKWRIYLFVAYVILGLGIGIAGGIRRSMYVAESLHENCVERVGCDAPFIFNIRDRYMTIPEQRTEGGRDRLRALGIYNVRDLLRLVEDLKENPGLYEQNRNTRGALFVSKYDYLSY